MSDILDLLYIQDNNSPSIIKISDNEKIYNIDLNSRTIEPIDTVIVESDHKSRVLYFKVPRYFDKIDLANMICIIEYINAKGEKYTYAVPAYDLSSFNNSICFYWEISQLAAKANGMITFGVSFYKIDPDEKKILYRLSTIPHSFRIENSIGFTIEDIRVEAQYVETPDTEMAVGKTYYKKIITDTGKKDQAGIPIVTVSYEVAKTMEEGKVYYEKVDLYNNSIDNYFKVLYEAVKASQTGDLTWIVLQ